MKYAKQNGFHSDDSFLTKIIFTFKSKTIFMLHFCLLFIELIRKFYYMLLHLTGVRFYFGYKFDVCLYCIST